MTSGRYGLVLREVGRLLGGGAVASLGAGPLLERFVAERDGAAFEALVGRHGPMVLGTCRRMLSDPHDVDDAFQATFLVLARKAGSIEDADRLGPWLHGVARRVAARSRALSSRRKSRERPGNDEPAAESPDLLEGLELREALDEELSRLPEKYRAPLVLCYLEGLTHDEAAEQLRWPVGTVRSRLSGGRDRLRAALTRRGLAPSAAVPVVLTQASVPQALLSTTVRVATAAGSPSVHVLNLAKGALIAMTWNKLKLIAALGLTAGLTVGGAGVSAQYGGMGKAEAKTDDAKIQESRAEPKRGVLEVRGLRHVDDQIKELEAERERLNTMRVDISMKIEQVQYDRAKELRRLQDQTVEVRSRIDALERRWKDLAVKGGLAAKAEDSDMASTAGDDRIKALEKQVADQKAMLQLQQDRGDNFRGIPVEEKSTRAAARAPDATIDQPKTEAIAKVTTDVRPPIDPTPKGVATTAGTAGLAPAPSANPPAAEAKKTANPRRRPANPMVMPLGGANILVIPVEQDRATVLNTKTGERVTQRFPQGVTEVVPVVGPGVVGLVLKGPEVRQIAAYDVQDGKWYPQELKEPTTEASPIVSPQQVTYQLGCFLYIFSAQAKKWSTLELRQDRGRGGNFSYGMGGLQDGRMMIPEGDFIHLYDPKTGEWTHINTKDDK